MFAPSVRIRRLAAKVLLVWLFALATGLVNACVIAPGLYAPHSALAAPAASVPDGMAHAGCPDCPDEDDATGAPGACGQFCLDKSSGVPTAKLALDPGPALGIALVPTLALSVAEPAASPLQRPESAAPPLVPIPVPIAYLRLTL